MATTDAALGFCIPESHTMELATALTPILDRVRTDVTAIKGPKGQSWTRQPLTPQRLQEHLAGGRARGVCPIKAGESTTRLGLLDLDSHKGEIPWDQMAATAQDIAEALEARGMRSVPFRSSGGNGIHLIVLWDEPQDAYTVRECMTEALADCGMTNGAGGLTKNQVEVFPKQDSVPADGFGNQFVLPLAGKSVPLEPLLGYEPMPREHVLNISWPSSQPLVTRKKPERTVEVAAPTDVDLQRLQEALAAIPNEGVDELDYDAWRNIVFGIHHATSGSDEGRAMAHAFSQRSSKYDPDFLDERVWPYIDSTRDEAITAQSIYAQAREHGWDAITADEFPVVEEGDIEPPPPSRFEPIPWEEFASGEPTRWLIKGILPQAELAVLYGASGSGKSFITLDMCAAIARGMPWRGRKVKQGRVVYVAAEGAGGFRKRLKALAKEHLIEPGTMPLSVVPAAPNFLDKADPLELTRAVQAFGGADVIVLDTFAQITPGGNENAGEDMGKALGYCKAMHRATGAVVLLVHHSGKDATKGARGWSGLRAAADAELEVTRLPMGRVLKATKQKDGEDGEEWAFDLKVVELGHDEDMDPITSCVVQEIEMPVGGAVLARELGPVEIVVNEVIQEVAKTQLEGIEVTYVVAEAARRLPQPEGGKRDTRKQRVRRAIGTLCEGDAAPYWLDPETNCIAVM